MESVEVLHHCYLLHHYYVRRTEREAQREREGSGVWQGEACLDWTVTLFVINTAMASVFDLMGS